MKAILNKLWGNNKRSTSVKAELQAVKLSKVEDLKNENEANWQHLEAMLTPVLNAISMAKEGLSDIREVFDDAYLTSSSVNELTLQIEELGIEMPADLEELYKQTEALADLGMQGIPTEVEYKLDEAEQELSEVYQKYF